MRLINFLILLFFLISCEDKNGNIYYLDATGGNDSHSGTSTSQAWKSLDRVKDMIFKPGDKLLLKRGDTFHGQLEFTGQGTQTERIMIDAYGEGDKNPCIIGNDTSLYAIRIYNSDYVTIQNLEIVNTGKERIAGRTGLKIQCSDYGTSHSIRVNGVTVRDVNGSLVKSEGGGSGILILNEGNIIPSRFDSLTIENCHILRCERNAMIWSGYSNRNNWHPSLHTVVRGNLIEGVPGDGIVPIGCDSTLIEYNVMRNCPDLLPITDAAAGFWPWSCDNTIIQFNDVSGHKAPWDAQAYDCDFNSTNTIIQYNYSHGNHGGLVLICDPGEEQKDYGIGNRDNKIRYNISIGDGIRPRKTHVGTYFSPGIHIGGPVRNTLIEYNIIHANPKPGKYLDRSMVTADSWNGYADSTTVRKNLFYAAEKSRFSLTKSTNNLYTGNWYLGEYEQLPDDKQKRLSSDFYNREVLVVDPKGYTGLYKLMDERIVGDSIHHFVNADRIEKFFRNLEAEQ